MMTIKQYQSTLHYYFAYYNDRIDGKVGSQTKAAIKAFQKAYGLSADGIYGTKTDAKLKGLVKNLQNNLKHYYGYYSGKIDGIIGSGTVAAIKRFQKGHNLTQDGIYGSSSHSRLTAQIKKLQRIVGVTQDGIIGTKTIAAIKAKQKSWGLTQDGVAGQKFWAKANGSGSGSSSSSSSGGSSAHFKKSEFKCGCNGRYCNGYPAGNMSPKLLDILEKIVAGNDELSDLDMPSQKAASRRNSLAANAWRMEDPYDNRQNRPAPYKRGQNSLSKAEIEKRLDREKEQRRVTQKMVETKEESLFLYPSKGLSIFK